MTFFESITTGAICDSYCLQNSWVVIATFIFLLWIVTLIILDEKNKQIKELKENIARMPEHNTTPNLNSSKTLIEDE